LEEEGIEVAMTRSGDQYLSQIERADVANNLNALLFVSIHCNAADNYTASGTETYFYAPLNDKDLFAQRGERLKLASSLQKQLLTKLQRNNRGIKEAAYTVLTSTNMPSALVEIAFISNYAERQLLQQDYFQERAAQAIAAGIIDYINN